MEDLIAWSELYNSRALLSFLSHQAHPFSFAAMVLYVNSEKVFESIPIWKELLSHTTRCSFQWHYFCKLLNAFACPFWFQVISSETFHFSMSLHVQLNRTNPKNNLRCHLIHFSNSIPYSVRSSETEVIYYNTELFMYHGFYAQKKM